MKQSTRIDVAASVERIWEVRREVGCGWNSPGSPPVKYVVTDFEPGRACAWVTTGPGVRTTARHLLEELGSGDARVTPAMGHAGPVGVVMGRFDRRLTHRYLSAEAEGIAAWSEPQV